MGAYIDRKVFFWRGSIGPYYIKNVRWDAKSGFSKTKYYIKHRVLRNIYLKTDKKYDYYSVFGWAWKSTISICI